MTRTLVSALLPLALLGALVALFTATNAGLDVAPPAPVERLSVERVMLEPGVIRLQVRNTGPSDLTLALVNINDSTWPATASPSNVIPRLGAATVSLDYPWVVGEAYKLALVTANAIVFHASIPVAFETPQPTLASAASFALIGLAVGVVPIALGVLWLPALRAAGRRATLFLVALTAGILAILGIDTLAEALEQGAKLPGPFQGTVLVGLGVLTTTLMLAALGFRQRGPRERGVAGGSLRSPGAPSPAPAMNWSLAWLIAVGIGLHNLGEGLAIGAAYAVGELSLGAFLVIGFILQNVTEGVAIVVPVLHDRLRPARLASLIAIAGLPAIAGTLVGALAYSLAFATLCLAIGAGAILQVLYEVTKLALRDTAAQRAPFTAVAGAVTGMAILYLTGVLVK